MKDRKDLIGDIFWVVFFIAILTIIGIFGSWAYVIFLFVLAIIGIAAYVVVMLVSDYLYEKQTKIKNPYFKSFLKIFPIYYLVRLSWLGLFVIIGILMLGKANYAVYIAVLIFALFISNMKRFVIKRIPILINSTFSRWGKMQASNFCNVNIIPFLLILSKL